MKSSVKVLLAGTLAATGVEAATVNGFDIGAYGFIKASAMYADQGLASYNDINLSAPTHAVAQSRSFDKTSRMSFQTQQSRAGVTFTKDKLSGKLEFDFIDFNKSSPTTQMNPRVRIAAVTYAWENNKVVIGQDWDLFSPVTSYTFDYVGLYFMAGNTGFMRQQAQYLKTIGDWEFGAALGMAGNNPGVTDNDLELGKSPTYALRASRKITDGRFGVSAIYSTLHFNETTTAPQVTKDSYGYNAFYEQKVGSFNLKSEAYYGQNLSNIGTLAIGKGTSTSTVREFGGTLTAQYMLDEVKSFFGGVGLAKIDNKGQLTPFNYNTTATSNPITQPGVRSNFLSRVGYEYKVTPDLSWLSEVSRYETDSKIADNNYRTRIAYSLESDIQFRF
jgi:hypothetical protein